MAYRGDDRSGGGKPVCLMHGWAGVPRPPVLPANPTLEQRRDHLAATLRLPSHQLVANIAEHVALLGNEFRARDGLQGEIGYYTRISEAALGRERSYPDLLAHITNRRNALRIEQYVETNRAGQQQQMTASGHNGYRFDND